jgi:hypothetical protein
MYISVADWALRWHEAGTHCESIPAVAEVLEGLDALRTAAVAWAVNPEEATVAALRRAIMDVGGIMVEMEL